MEIQNSLIFNNINSLELGVLVTKYPTIYLNNENVEYINVEGRNGSLVQRKGTYPDRKLEFELMILDLDKSNFFYKKDVIMEWLYNIEDNRLFYDRKDKYYKVKTVTLDSFTRAEFLDGTFKVTFLVEPFLYLAEDTSIELENNMNIEYTGTANSLPILEVFGTGNVQINFNKNTLNITNVKDYVKVDSKLLEVLDKNNLEVENGGNFPVLIPGKNTINFSGNINKIILKYNTLFR